MNMIKIFGIIFILGIVMTLGSDVGERFSIPGAQSLVSVAEARVGRPLTPVSVAGVARRTVRRCAVGVYNCGLPESNLRIASLGRIVPEFVLREVL